MSNQGAPTTQATILNMGERISITEPQGLYPLHEIGAPDDAVKEYFNGLAQFAGVSLLQYKKMVLPNTPLMAIAAMIVLLTIHEGKHEMWVGSDSVANGWVPVDVSEDPQQRFTGLHGSRSLSNNPYILINCAREAVSPSWLSRVRATCSHSEVSVHPMDCNQFPQRVSILAQPIEQNNLQGLVYKTLRHVGVCLNNIPEARPKLLINPSANPILATYLAICFRKALGWWPLHFNRLYVNSQYKSTDPSDMPPGSVINLDALEQWVVESGLAQPPKPSVSLSNNPPAEFVRRLIELANEFGVDVR